jgi:hypothetical protein
MTKVIAFFVLVERVGGAVLLKHLLFTFIYKAPHALFSHPLNLLKGPHTPRPIIPKIILKADFPHKNP